MRTCAYWHNAKHFSSFFFAVIFRQLCLSSLQSFIAIELKLTDLHNYAFQVGRKLGVRKERWCQSCCKERWMQYSVGWDMEHSVLDNGWSYRGDKHMVRFAIKFWVNWEKIKLIACKIKNFVWLCRAQKSNMEKPQE